jgi:hypothetical protein
VQAKEEREFADCNNMYLLHISLLKPLSGTELQNNSTKHPAFTYINMNRTKVTADWKLNA